MAVFDDLIKNKGLLKYSKNTIWLLIYKVISLGLGFFVGIWVARYLGVEQYGVYNYVLSFTGLFIVLTSLGFHHTAVRDLCLAPDDRDILLGAIFYLKMWGGVIAFVLMIIISQFMPSNDDYINLLIAIIALGFIFNSFDVIDLYFQSQVLGKLIFFAYLPSIILTNVLKIALILNQAPLILFVGVLTLERVVTAIGLVFFYRKQNLLLRHWRFIRKRAMNILKENVPLIISSSAILIYMKIDQVMINMLINAKAVGIYSAAAKLSEVWIFITVIVAQSVFPAILDAKLKSQTLYYNRLRWLYQFVIAIALSISLFYTIFAEKIIYYTFGSEYAASKDILLIYIWAIVFVFINNVSWKWYVTENLQSLGAYKLVLCAVLNIILNIVLIKQYSLQGAAYATIISYSIAGYFGNLLHKKTIINFKIQTLAIINCFNIRSYFR